MSKNHFKVNPETFDFRCAGVDVAVYDDDYPVGHQGGISIIMNDLRMAANGDLRFEQTPGQWQPVPKRMRREYDVQNDTVTAIMHFPDERSHLRGFNPAIYPDVVLDYKVDVKAEGDGVRVTVNLDHPVPECLLGKLCFNLELVPVHVIGKPWIMDEEQGVFPPQPNGPTLAQPANIDHAGVYPIGNGRADLNLLTGDRNSYNPIIADDIIAAPYACGHCFTVRPEEPKYRFTVISEETELKLYDGRMNHNNGWFVLSSEIPAGKTANALSWLIVPEVVDNWMYKPVIQTSQVGFHPAQSKYAMIELDSRDKEIKEAVLNKITAKGAIPVKSIVLPCAGNFLRYHYLRFDFTDITEEGLYQVIYGDSVSTIFKIAKNVYDRGVWQPVLEYFLPVQMCHMQVREKYRIWHGHCHSDDATMAPVNFNHFDGYFQGPSTLTKYQPGDHIPGLDKGGWHDAGDYDLRIESQAGEVYNLVLAYEEFDVNYDSSTIDQENHLVEIHQPDGKNDILQQIEHGLLTVVGGYEALGRLYRGIICRDLRQYVLLGDAREMTAGIKGGEDARLVFTEDNPNREFFTAGQLAAAARTMRGFNDTLADKSLAAAEELFAVTREENALPAKIAAATELFITTKKEGYREFLLTHINIAVKAFEQIGWIAVRALPYLDNAEYTAALHKAAENLNNKFVKELAQTPYRVPYRLLAWGNGWNVQSFGVRYYFLYKAFSDIFSKEPITDALNFVLGCHPGLNTASFASGVGAKSATTAYCAYRAEWSYIPGGVISGTELIRPDFPELLEFPFLWQQGEYVLGGGSSHYMFLVLAVASLYR